MNNIFPSLSITLSPYFNRRRRLYIRTFENVLYINSLSFINNFISRWQFQVSFVGMIQHDCIIFTVSMLFFLATGVPVKLLHESEGHIVTIELKNGEVYRGMLTEAEDTMNCQLKEGKAKYVEFIFHKDFFVLILLLRFQLL